MSGETSKATNHANAPTLNIRRFRCRTCRRGFTKAEHLMRHERSHSQQRPFSCEICFKSFGRQDVLLRHTRIHEDNPRNDTNEANSDTTAPELGTGDSTTMFHNSALSNLLNTDPILREPPQQCVQHNGVHHQRFEGSDDLLELLTSDLNFNWPVTLPVLQISNLDHDASTSIYSDSVEAPLSASADTPGQHAMSQMSRLVGNLAVSLTAEIVSTGITSSFLDTCLHMFFDKFSPSFPVLHKPTFSVQESSHPLLLNIMALGSLYVGAQDAVSKGESLWRLAHTVVATSWQALMATRGPYDKAMGVQLILTALLGQTYALLSKNESLRMTSKIFHGLGFYWARMCGMYEPVPSFDLLVLTHQATQDEKITAWRSWVALEVQNRAILGHYILDGQISQLSGHAACVRHVTNPLFLSASTKLFGATTADEWIAASRADPAPRISFRQTLCSIFSASHLKPDYASSSFSIRVVLEGIQSLAAEVHECDGQVVGISSKHEVSQALLRVHNDVLGENNPNFREKMELLLRWHTICLNLAAPSARLCNSICSVWNIEQSLYPSESLSFPTKLKDWLSTTDALRALLHSAAIQEIVENLPLAGTHAIHVPTAVFSAATIFAANCLVGRTAVVLPSTISWDDVWACHTTSQGAPSIRNQELSKFLQNQPITGRRQNLLYDINSTQMTLRSLSLKWGVALEMDKIIQGWVAIVLERGA